MFDSLFICLCVNNSDNLQNFLRNCSVVWYYCRAIEF